MEGKVLRALLLTIVMLLSGCTGSDDAIISDKETEVPVGIFEGDFELFSNSYAQTGLPHAINGITNLTYSDEIDQTTLGITVTFVASEGIVEIENSIQTTGDGFIIIWSPTQPGEWLIQVELNVLGSENVIYTSIILDVEPPTESATAISMETIHELAMEGPYTLSGTVSHSNTNTCTITTDQGHSRSLNEDSEFTIPLGIVEEDMEVIVTATCGKMD